MLPPDTQREVTGSFTQRAKAVLWATALAPLVAGFASLTWGGLLLTNLATNSAIPWSFVVMAGVLWLMWQYLSDRRRPRSATRAHRSGGRRCRGSGGLSLVALVFTALAA